MKGLVRSLRAGVLISMLAACSEVQSVQLGELAGTRGAPVDAGAFPLAPNANRDAGMPPALPDQGQLDASAAPTPSQPSAADAGASLADAQTEDKDIDDDEDEDSEESSEPERRRDDEDAGEPSDD